MKAWLRRKLEKVNVNNEKKHGNVLMNCLKVYIKLLLSTGKRSGEGYNTLLYRFTLLVCNLYDTLLIHSNMYTVIFYFRNTFCDNLNKRQRIPKGHPKKGNPEKLATQGTKDEEKQNKIITQYVLDNTIHKQTQIT